MDISGVGRCKSEYPVTLLVRFAMQKLFSALCQPMPVPSVFGDRGAALIYQALKWDEAKPVRWHRQ